MEQAIKKIVILGAESTGKSTLTKDLAKHYSTNYVPEYARTYFEHNDINNYSIKDLEIIANQQSENELSCMQKANNYLFCDTSIITVKIWAQNEFKKVPSLLSKLINKSDYKLFLICNNDVPWVDDGQRKHEHLREHIFKLNKHELVKQNNPYHIIKGIGDERKKMAIDIIDNFFATNK